MELTYGELKERAAAVAAALADARSARNLLSRRKAEDEHDERQAETARRRQKRKNVRELEELLRRKVRVRVPAEERPKIGGATARNLYHRAAGMLLGVTGLSDARGPDGLYSIHFAFTARGFASTKGRRWRRGEAERAARYIVREEGLERGELSWWSNIAADRNELVAFYRAVETLERHDRSNANVYISEVIALPAELSARQRRRAVRRICRFFEERRLPYTVAIHLPDASGDKRNYHCHIIYSLRPCERVGPYEWSFGVAKDNDINTPDGIMARRIAAVRAINKTLQAAGIAKRYTHLSNKARRMAAAQPKLGQQRTWADRRLAALEASAATLRGVETGLQQAITTIAPLAARLQDLRAMARQRLTAIGEGVTSRPALAERLSQHRTGASARLAVAGTELGVFEGAASIRMAKAQLSARDLLVRWPATLAAASDGSRVPRARALAAANLSRAMAAATGSHMAQRPRLRQADAGAQRWLHQSAGKIVARRQEPAARLAGIGARASGLRMLEIRQSQLANMLERLGHRAAAGQAHAVTAVLKLSGDTMIRSALIGEGRVKLAGMGAVARVREVSIKRSVLVQAIDARLSRHKVLFGRIRNRAAGASAKMEAAIGSSLNGARARLTAAAVSPQLVRWRALGEMLAVVERGRRASLDRIEAAQERVQIRLTSTINQVRWTIRGAEAGLRDVRHEAVRRYRLDLLTARSATVKTLLGRSRDCQVAVGQVVGGALTEQLASLHDGLAAGKSRLVQANETMQRLVRRAVDAPTTVGGAHDVNSSEQSGSASAATATERNAGHGALAAGSVSKLSNTETLRKIVATRTPETDLHVPVLPSGRGPLPGKKPSKVAAMWQRLRGEAKNREVDAHAELRGQALRRLAASRAIITQGENGVFVADVRGLFAEERQALRRTADHNLVQAGLAKLWQAQERRRREAGATASSSVKASPLPGVFEEEGVSPEVQSQFLARLKGKGR